MPLDDSERAGVMPQAVRGRHGSCSCASQTSSGLSARTRSWPSVCGSSSSPNHTATSPPTTTGRLPVSTTTICMPRVWPGARTSRSPGSSSSSPSTGTYRTPGASTHSVVLAARVLKLPTLDVGRPAGEELVAAAVVEVQVRVDDDVDDGEIEVLLAQWPEAGIHVGHRRAGRQRGPA